MSSLTVSSNGRNTHKPCRPQKLSCTHKPLQIHSAATVTNEGSLHQSTSMSKPTRQAHAAVGLSVTACGTSVCHQACAMMQWSCARQCVLVRNASRHPCGPIPRTLLQTTRGSLQDPTARGRTCKVCCPPYVHLHTSHWTCQRFRPTLA